MTITEPPGDGSAPVDEGWEPEPERAGAWARFRDGPVDYFRAVPARFFAWLGALVFVAGWAAAVYAAWLADSGSIGNTPTSYRVQVLLNHGMTATIAAGILWAVAAFLWVKVLPALPDDAPEP